MRGSPARASSSRLRSPFFRGRNPEVDELADREAGDRDGGGDGRGSGHGDDRDAVLGRGPYKLGAGVVDPGHPGVGYQGDVPLLQRVQKLGQLGLPVALAVAGETGLDVVPREQLAGDPGVLGRDQVDLAQDPQGALGDILEVADRGRNDV